MSGPLIQQPDVGGARGNFEVAASMTFDSSVDEELVHFFRNNGGDMSWQRTESFRPSPAVAAPLENSMGPFGVALALDTQGKLNAVAAGRTRLIHFIRDAPGNQWRQISVIATADSFGTPGLVLSRAGLLNTVVPSRGPSEVRHFF